MTLDKVCSDTEIFLTARGIELGTSSIRNKCLTSNHWATTLSYIQNILWPYQRNKKNILHVIFQMFSLCYRAFCFKKYLYPCVFKHAKRIFKIYWHLSKCLWLNLWIATWPKSPMILLRYFISFKVQSVNETIIWKQTGWLTYSKSLAMLAIFFIVTSYSRLLYFSDKWTSNTKINDNKHRRVI